MILMGANPFSGPLAAMGPENLDFFGPKWHSLCSWLFQGKKLLDFLVFIFGSTVLNNRPKKGLVHCVNRTFVILLRNIYNFFKIIFIPNRPASSFQLYTTEGKTRSRETAPLTLL
jgi:hypothetical protein